MELPSIYINRVLSEAAKRSASALHLSIGNPPIIRLDGSLRNLDNEDIVVLDLLQKIIETILSPEELESLKSVDRITAVKTFGGSFRFRVNIFSQKGLPSVSFHYIPSKIKNPAELNLPIAIKDQIALRSGLFIVAGAYGSGKTTTCAALIEEINRSVKKYVITIEDPIEYLFMGKQSIIEQRQVGKDVASVTNGLEHCLNEDVDVVYLGEITHEFDAALPLILDLSSGNSLVILELNADDAIKVIDKLLDALKDRMSPEAARYSLADAINGIFVSKLLPRRGGGVMLVPELMIATPAIKAMIRDNKSYQIESVIQTSRKDGMISMAKTIEELISAGEIKREDL